MQSSEKLAALRGEFEALARPYLADNLVRQDYLLTRAIGSLTETTATKKTRMTDDTTSALRAVNHVVGGPGLFTSLDAVAQAVVERELQWTWLNGGDVLFRQGDAGDARYWSSRESSRRSWKRAAASPRWLARSPEANGSARWPC